MSVRAMTWAWDQRMESPPRKLVLLALADHADDRGRCWPTIDQVAAKAELSPRTVRRYLSELERMGLVRRQRRRRKDGTLGTYAYGLSMRTSSSGRIRPLAEEDEEPPRQEVEGVQLPSGSSSVSSGRSRPLDTANANPSEDGVNTGISSGASGRSRPVAGSDQWPDPVVTSGRSCGRAEPSVEPSDSPPPCGGPPPLATEVDDLADYLGQELADHVLPSWRARPGWSRREDGALLSQWGPGGLDPTAWRDGTGTPIPEGDRPRLLALVLVRMAGEGQRLHGRLFRRVLQAVIQEQQSPAARGSPGGGPDDWDAWGEEIKAREAAAGGRG